MAEEPKKFTPKQVQEFNGSNGKPAYVIFAGRVIDVSSSPHWQQGLHMATHRAGRDLTPEMEAAPHGPEVLDRFPEVGVIKTEEPARKEIPAFLSRLFHYLPLLRRHPHPMVVHFPIVFMISTTGFTLLYLLTDIPSFETTAWHCLWGGVLFTPAAMTTGLFTWWINYEAEWLRPVVIKMVLSPILFILSLIALVWRYCYPGVLTSWGSADIAYFVMVLALAPLVMAIGWYGASLSFPLEKE